MQLLPSLLGMLALGPRLHAARNPKQCKRRHRWREIESPHPTAQLSYQHPLGSRANETYHCWYCSVASQSHTANEDHDQDAIPAFSLNLYYPDDQKGQQIQSKDSNAPSAPS